MEMALCLEQIVIKKLKDFKKDSLSIPVINGLSPSSHPTQVLSDIFTVEEIKKKPISKLNICPG